MTFAAPPRGRRPVSAPRRAHVVPGTFLKGVGETRGGALGSEFLARYRENNLGGLAAELAYRIFLSLFPFLILVAALGGLIASAADVSDPGSRLVSVFGDSLPADASSLIRGQARGVTEGSHAGAVSIGTIAAIWTASAAAGTLSKAMNRIFQASESRAFWKKTALSVGMTVSAGLALLLVTAVLVDTQVYAAETAAWVGLGRGYNFVVQLLRLPLVIGVVIFAAALVYRIAPDHSRRFRFISPGVVAFGVSWTTFTTGFAYYIASFGSIRMPRTGRSPESSSWCFGRKSPAGCSSAAPSWTPSWTTNLTRRRLSTRRLGGPAQSPRRIP